MTRLSQLCSAFSLLVVCGTMCSASELVFIRSESTVAIEQTQLEAASQFYGLSVKIISVLPDADAGSFDSIRQKDTLAVAVDGHALGLINAKALLRSLERRDGAHVPLLVMGLTTDDRPGILNRWSGGDVLGVGRLAEPTGLKYIFGHVPGVTDELSGISLPYRGQPPYIFRLRGDASVQKLLTIETSRGDLPVLVEAHYDRQPIFFACATTFQRRDDRAIPGPDIVDAFTSIAPAMVFLKFAAGDHGWHAPGHYANLTIDDPWLRERYGHLDYAKLLVEMKAHTFHTTIAFIPWNYSRSVPEVISIFRENPERYSIAVHGDDHDHKEFEDFRDSPLSVQAPKLEQALARMDAFQNITGIPFDRVFVFPHSIGECLILQELKRDNYLATVNSTNVPMGCKRPTDPMFDLRPVTTAFYDFPSILRYPADVPAPRSLIAVNDFLDNPLFFYVHQEFFARGVGAFDKIADEMNTVEPRTEWRGLGYIAAHLFLIRKRHDSGYEVSTFSRAIDLENSSTALASYRIEKQESNPALVQSVTVNSRPISYAAEGKFLRFTVTLPSGGSAHVLVTYRNTTNLADVSITHHSVHVYLLRMASDFRDIWLSQFSFGEGIVDYYYQHDETPGRVVTLAAVIAVIAIGALWFLVAVVRRRRADTPTKEYLNK